SGALSVTLDTAGPAAPTPPDLQAGSDSGPSNADNYTNATSRAFDLAGVEAGATVSLLRGGASVGTRSGNGAVTDSTASADGPLSYTARATDAAGNIGAASGALSVTLDTVAPAAPTAPDLQAGSDSGAS